MIHISSRQEESFDLGVINASEHAVYIPNKVRQRLSRTDFEATIWGWGKLLKVALSSGERQELTQARPSLTETSSFDTESGVKCNTSSTTVTSLSSFAYLFSWKKSL